MVALRPYVTILPAMLRPLALVVAVVATVIISQALRIPLPDISAYIIFFIANDDGVRVGVTAIVTITGHATGN